jgi:hypothetical protein
MSSWSAAGCAPERGVGQRIEADATGGTVVPGVWVAGDFAELTAWVRLRELRVERGIEPGEAVEFSTWTAHWFGAIDGPVEALGIFGPHGERVHLHR